MEYGPEDAIKLLFSMPNPLWQCESCAVNNDSHTRTDELMDEIQQLICLYLMLKSKYEIAFPELFLSSINVNMTHDKKIKESTSPIPTTSHRASPLLDHESEVRHKRLNGFINGSTPRKGILRHWRLLGTILLFSLLSGFCILASLR